MSLETSDASPQRAPFARIPAWIFSSGLWARLKPVEIRVLGVICFSANNKTGISMRTIDYLAKHAGVARSSVPQATKMLVSEGAITARRTGYRKQYRLVETPPQWVVDGGWLPKRRSKCPTAFAARSQSGAFAVSL